jgi:hypothetical protein
MPTREAPSPSLDRQLGLRRCKLQDWAGGKILNCSWIYARNPPVRRSKSRIESGQRDRVHGSSAHYSWQRQRGRYTDYEARPMSFSNSANWGWVRMGS